MLIVLALMASFALPSLAQNKKVEDRIQLARDRYAAGLENIAINKQYEADKIPAVGYTATVRKQNWAGSGQMTDKIEFYYNEIEEAMEPYPVGYELVIVRRTYNIAARDYFEEYVYDAKGKPLFWFARYDDGGRVELRGYFNENGELIRAICKKADGNGKMKECGLDDNMELAFIAAPNHFIALYAAFQAIYSVNYSY